MSTPQLVLTQPPRPIVETRYICPICHERFESEALCREGLNFIPYDPLPLGSNVKKKGDAGKKLWGKGVVTTSKVANWGIHGHEHIRNIYIKLKSGGVQSFYITRDNDRSQEWELDQLQAAIEQL